jgi:hypothetical protein
LSVDKINVDGINIKAVEIPSPYRRRYVPDKASWRFDGKAK